MKKIFSLLVITIVLISTLHSGTVCANTSVPFWVTYNSVPYRTYSQDGMNYVIFDQYDRYTDIAEYHKKYIGNAYLYEITDSANPNIVIPDYINNCKVILDWGDKLFADKAFIETITFNNHLDKIPAIALRNCKSLRAIYLPANNLDLSSSAFRGGTVDGNYSSVFYLSNLRNIFFGGSEEEWNAITNGEGINYFGGTIYDHDSGRTINDLSKVVTVHFNATGIGNIVNKPAFPEIKDKAISLSVYNSTDKSLSGMAPLVKSVDPQTGKKEYHEDTGDLFTFSVTLSDSVNVADFSISADLLVEPFEHAISAREIYDLYGYKSVTKNTNGTITVCWEMKIYNPGYRTFEIEINGIKTGVTANVNVVEQNNLPSDNPVALPTDGGGFLPYSPANVDVLVNGNAVNFDVPPCIINNRTMIPVRAVAEAFGASVDYYADSGEIKILGNYKYSGNPVVLELTIGNEWLDIFYPQNTIGNSIQLDSPPVAVNNRTLVPIRPIAERFGYTVEWIEETNTVNIH